MALPASLHKVVCVCVHEPHGHCTSHHVCINPPVLAASLILPLAGLYRRLDCSEIVPGWLSRLERKESTLSQSHCCCGVSSTMRLAIAVGLVAACSSSSSANRRSARVCKIMLLRLQLCEPEQGYRCTPHTEHTMQGGQMVYREQLTGRLSCHSVSTGSGELK